MAEIGRSVFGELKRHDDTLTPQARKRVEDLICRMCDDYLTTQMYWTKRRAEFSESYYLEQIQDLVNKHPSPQDLIYQTSDKIAVLIADTLELPTWHILSVRIHHGLVHIEVGEDYRVVDWMKNNAEEYGLEGEKHVW